MPRARALILKDGAVALIRRWRDGRLYHVFPGGGVEEGESPREAVIREVREELGLLVDPHTLVATVSQGGDSHDYFLADIVGGEFGAGHGLEATGRTAPARGTYTPIWMPIGALPHATVYPRCMADLVLSSVTDGWPEHAVTLDDSEPA
jgi:8-oxo-dGTP pyrophosphatase MutT (NUDIX family)